MGIFVIIVSLGAIGFLVGGSIYAITGLIGYSFFKKQIKEDSNAKNEGTTFTAPESGTYKVTGTITTQNAEYVEGCGLYMIPKGSTPVFIEEGPAGKVYYKEDTNEIIDGNDLVLLGDL